MMCACESWTIKRAEFQRVVSSTCGVEKTLENPLDYKEIKQSILKEINPEYSLEGLMLKLSSGTLAADEEN